MIWLIRDDPLFPPPASPDPYEGRSDRQVLAIAAGALRRAEALPAGSITRQVQWSIFDAAMGELQRRAVVHALRKAREQQP
jgi:hypothetical protein